ncbi:MAG: HesA/MoeB/ThiF family protein [Caldiserica bacterium]|jgi:molybdopterin/thiamine biosynthesis adenylyltransferase|nr:HesA/MoeB/ThiF family protein [Caldisericota bacterium]MDH7563099.1 HesA/MoeB/ThiF family protein [Caldisericota bacterium]
MRKEGTIWASSKEIVLPTGKKRWVMETEKILELANLLGKTPKEVTILALKQGIIPLRYERNIDSIGVDGQRKLVESRVAIIGIGGLGGWVAEILTRMGVGFLRLVDGDNFMESNLNRQLGSQQDLLGKNKALEMKRRLEKVNPIIELEAVAEFLSSENSPSIIADVDLCVDALGDITQRFTLWEECRKFKKTMVHGAIGGLLGQAALFYPQDQGIERIYGKKEQAPKQGAEAELGTPSPTPAFVGTFEASLTIQFLLGKGDTFRGKLFLFDLERGNFHQISLF